MSDTPYYRALADAFVAEGVDTQFVLMGDGNMHFSSALDVHPNILSVHVRHEHCAVAAATSYALATGKIGVASVTCGPGLTQLMTALPAAVRASVPLVVFSGETPLHARFYNQAIDQAPLVLATGAHYIRAHSLRRLMDHVREAFHFARSQRRPVVIGIPYDLQKVVMDDDTPYVPSTAVLADGGRPWPDPERVAQLVTRLKSAQCPILVGGRGAVRSGAVELMEKLADRIGALLGATLPVRGLFHDHPFSIGIIGGYSSEVAKDVLARADLVIAVGTSLSYYTKDAGHLFPNATTVQIDLSPSGIRDGMTTADFYITCDARAGLEAIFKALNDDLGADGKTVADIRTEALAERLHSEPADSGKFDIAPGVLDPRSVIAALDDLIPKDWDIVTGSGHQAYFNAQMRGRPADRFLTVREFGAIGNGLSYVLGVAAARRQGRDGQIVLIEGDGGVMMHIQELETLKRLGFRVLICVMNDGAYGSEIYKLRSDGISDRLATFGRPAFEKIAAGFGLSGAEVTDTNQFPALFETFLAQGETALWNIQISDQLPAPTMRNTLQRGHGVM